MDTIDPLLTDVEAFLESEGMTATAFGVKSLNDPTFVHELRRGRDCKRATRLRIGEFIKSHSTETVQCSAQQSCSDTSARSFL